MRFRGTYRGEQLQHVLANTRREENLLSVRQPWQSEANSNSDQQTAGEPLNLRPHVDEALGRRQADTVPATTTPWQTEEAPSLPQTLSQARPEAKHEAQKKAQEG